MQYYVCMNERELKIALLLMQKLELKNVISVDDDFSYDEDLIQVMLKKKFLKMEDNHCKWNPFVQMIFHIMINSMGCMYQVQSDGSVCHFYYWKDAVVMLSKKSEETQYVFYLVSLVPKMIGGMAKCHERFEKQMPPVTAYEKETLAVVETDRDSLFIQNELVKRNLCLSEGDIQIRFDAYWDNNLHYAAVLFKRNDGKYILAEGTHAELEMQEVDYYSMIQTVSKIMIEMHGRSIQMAGGV